jgi:hypothetical protein
VIGPVGSTITDGTPRFTISTSGFTSAQQPVQLRLQVSLASDFSAPLFADTTVTGTNAQVVIPRLLPPQVTVWWRVVARPSQGGTVSSPIDGPHRTSAWVTLLAPNLPNGTTVTTTKPTFVWSGVAIYPPVAGWQYRLVISRKQDGFPALTNTSLDTSYTALTDLESNTPYFWSVTATAGTGDSVRVVSSASFVIQSANAPLTTVMYQGFPTPFPTAQVPFTCFWFDLRAQSDVSIEVLDLRGNHVARILPGRGVGNGPGGTLPAGRYGRTPVNGTSNCDSRISWDGTDDRGRAVPKGVYLVKFTGDNVQMIHKVVFRGK